MKREKGIDIPDNLFKLLRADREALRLFQMLRPSCRREYVQSLAEAKREPTRMRRLSGALTRIREFGARPGALDLERA